jgi:hypothetical protein
MLQRLIIYVWKSFRKVLFRFCVLKSNFNKVKIEKLVLLVRITFEKVLLIGAISKNLFG